MTKISRKLRLVVAARQSLLSQAQVVEVHAELKRFYPGIIIESILVESRGDRDHMTSLRTLEESDFFTREVDALVLEERARVAVHSAKDLPKRLPEGLECVALTRGVDPGDAVVLRPGEGMRRGMCVATSSLRREERVLALQEGVRCVDIRGTIEKRLEKVFSGEVDGVVVARAALIRLGLTHLNCVELPGETAPLQGRLAVIARRGDEEMQTVFGAINA